MFRNKRIFIFGGVFVSLCILFLVHGVKSSDKNKEKYFISIEKHSGSNGVNMTIKKNDKTTVVTTCQLEKKNSLTNDKFQNVYSLQDNDIAEILSNSECEFLDGKEYIILFYVFYFHGYSKINNTLSTVMMLIV